MRSQISLLRAFSLLLIGVLASFTIAPINVAGAADKATTPATAARHNLPQVDVFRQSHDGGRHWSPARPGQNVTPICTSILRYARAGGQAESASLILWTGPRGAERRDLVLRISRDQGRTFPAELLIGPGPAAYSNMALLDGGDIGVLWEGGESHRYERVIFTRIPAGVIESLANRTN